MRSARPKSFTKNIFRELFELLTSMRFAIASLVLVAIASVIGTVLPQKFPRQTYINQFGEFWFGMFDFLSFSNVYNAPWFLCVFAFLIVSTALCVWRSTPKIWREMRSFREKLKLENLRAMGATTEQVGLSKAALIERLTPWLQKQGFKIRQIQHEHFTLISAKKGAANRIGYWLTHVAIIVIALGALLDSDLPINAKIALENKQAIPNNVVVPLKDANVLAPNTFSFRGNIFIPEGQTVREAEIAVPDGRLVQMLPFSLELKRFRIEHYPNGMPRLFASDVVLTDFETKQKKEFTIKVNEPLVHRGFAIYQSGFDDGGSALTLKYHDFSALTSVPQDVNVTVGSELKNPFNLKDVKLQITKFSAMNVRDDVLPIESQSPETNALNKLEAQLGSAAKANQHKKFLNVGSSYDYKLQYSNGNTVAVQQFMQPIFLDGLPQFVTLIQPSANIPGFSIRLPADENNQINTILALRKTLDVPNQRAQAVKNYVAQIESSRIQMGLPPHFLVLPEKILEAYARGGLPAVQKIIDDMIAFLNKTSPLSADKQQSLRLMLIDFLRGSLWELYQITRAELGKSPAEKTEAQRLFLDASMFGLSTLMESKLPFYLELVSFKETKATILQVSKTPGEGIVFFGSLILVLGIFALFFIPMQRVWFGVVATQTGVEILWVFNTPRKILATKKQHAQFAEALRELLDVKKVFS